MNDKDWFEKEEFWDNEVDEDDEDNFNGLDGNIDANNDETFGDAAEWNEDEHEELIARDLILSNTHQRTNRSGNNSSNKHINSSSNTRSDRRDRIDSSLSRTLVNNSRNNSSRERQEFAFLAVEEEPNTARNSNWGASKPPSNDEIQALIKQRLMQEQPRSSTSNEMPWQDSSEASQRLHILQLQQQAQEQLRALSAQPQLGHLSAQSRLILEGQTRLQQLNDQRHLMQQRLQVHQQLGPTGSLNQTESVSSNLNLTSPQKSVSQPKVLTVDELERQLLKTSINQTPQQAPRTSKTGAEPSRRAGWSPFGSKDLFNTDDPTLMSNPLLDPTLLQSIQPQTLTLEQHRLILEQQQKLLQRQQLQLQQFALFKQQQLLQHNRQQHQLNQQRQVQQQQQLQQQQQNTDSGPISSTAQCFTVEELERRMLANRGNNTEETKPKMVNLIRLAPEKPARPEPTTKQKSEENRHRHFQDGRNGDRHEAKFERHNNHRDFDSRDHHRDRRENKTHREQYKHHKKQPKIVPPQVQLGVIEKAKRMHPITPMHSDEFLQDRIPTTGDGFRFSRHSTVTDIKADHDGVLTDKERDWLTRIQGKIQADYDDNIDQDYYYLLYFNRSSMSDEAAQKPSGPGVFDRRFTPRERLLYNSGV